MLIYHFRAKVKSQVTAVCGLYSDATVLSTKIFNNLLSMETNLENQSTVVSLKHELCSDVCSSCTVMYIKICIQCIVEKHACW